MAKSETYSNTYKMFFIADLEALERIYRLIKKHTGRSDITVDFKNQRSRDLEKFSELKDISNAGSAEISSIRFHGFKDLDYSISFIINSESTHAVYLRIVSPVNRIDYLIRACEDQIKALDASYPIWARTDGFVMFIATQILYLLYVFGQIAIDVIQHGKLEFTPFKTDAFFSGVLKAFGIQAILLLTVLTIAKVIRILYPRGIFLVGHGAQRYQRLKAKRVFSLAILPVIIPLLWSVLHS